MRVAIIDYGSGNLRSATKAFERAARETLALPIYPELSAEQLQYVVETVAQFYS